MNLKKQNEENGKEIQRLNERLSQREICLCLKDQTIRELEKKMEMMRATLISKNEEIGALHEAIAAKENMITTNIMIAYFLLFLAGMFT